MQRGPRCWNAAHVSVRLGCHSSLLPSELEESRQASVPSSPTKYVPEGGLRGRVRELEEEVSRARSRALEAEVQVRAGTDMRRVGSPAFSGHINRKTTWRRLQVQREREVARQAQELADRLLQSGRGSWGEGSPRRAGKSAGLADASTSPKMRCVEFELLCRTSHIVMRCRGLQDDVTCTCRDEGGAAGADGGVGASLRPLTDRALAAGAVGHAGTPGASRRVAGSPAPRAGATPASQGVAGSSHGDRSGIKTAPPGSRVPAPPAAGAGAGESPEASTRAPGAAAAQGPSHIMRWINAGKAPSAFGSTTPTQFYYRAPGETALAPPSVTPVRVAAAITGHAGASVSSLRSRAQALDPGLGVRKDAWASPFARGGH